MCAYMCIYIFVALIFIAMHWSTFLSDALFDQHSYLWTLKMQCGSQILIARSYYEVSAMTTGNNFDARSSNTGSTVLEQQESDLQLMLISTILQKPTELCCFTGDDLVHHGTPLLPQPQVLCLCSELHWLLLLNK